MLDWLRNIFQVEPIDCYASSHDPLVYASSLLVTIGMGISYLPQHIKIILKKSSDGLSPYYLLLGSMSMVSLISNTVLLQYGHLKCCRIQSSGECFENSMGIVMIFEQFICYIFLHFLFIRYFPRERRYISIFDPSNSEPKKIMTLEYKIALRTGLIICLYFLFGFGAAVFLLLAYGDGSESEISEVYGDLMGLVSMVASSFQFLPQIFKTLKLKKVGSLSIPSMLIQTPGAFILVYALASRPGNNFTNWITYVVAGSLQAFLLAACIVFWLRERKENKIRDEFQHLLDDEADSDVDKEKETLFDTEDDDRISLRS